MKPSDLRALSTLRDFSDADLDMLLTVAPARVLPAGTVLYAQDERASDCFLLVRGSVQIERSRASGVEVVAKLEPGTFVGQVAMIDRGLRTATVRTIERCEGLVLDATLFDHLFSHATPLCLAFQDQLAIAGIRQFRGVMARLAALPAPRATDPAVRTERLTAISDIMSEWGCTSEELDSVEFVAEYGKGWRRQT